VLVQRHHGLYDIIQDAAMAAHPDFRRAVGAATTNLGLRVPPAVLLFVLVVVLFAAFSVFLTFHFLVLVVILFSVFVVVLFAALPVVLTFLLLVLAVLLVLVFIVRFCSLRLLPLLGVLLRLLCIFFFTFFFRSRKYESKGHE